MENKFKVIGGLSRKAKFNIAIAVTLLFMIITVFASIGQVKQIIEKREGITELEEKLSYYRNENIELLVTRYGGHCAFLKNWKMESWADDVIVERVLKSVP